MFFNSIKEINRLRKQINRLLSKEMLNTYLKVIIKKNWCYQTSIFLVYKICDQINFWKALTHADIIEELGFFFF